jgi:outer membrane biosynthesis protein TonB
MDIVRLHLLRQEEAHLSVLTATLSAALRDPTYDLPANHRPLMEKQLEAMHQYGDILSERLALGEASAEPQPQPVPGTQPQPVPGTQPQPVPEPEEEAEEEEEEEEEEEAENEKV